MANRLREGATCGPAPRWLSWTLGIGLLVFVVCAVSLTAVAVAQSVPSTERVKSFVVPCHGLNPDCAQDIQWQFSAFAANPQIHIHERELAVTPRGAMVLMVFYTEASNRP